MINKQFLSIARLCKVLVLVSLLVSSTVLSAQEEADEEASQDSEDEVHQANPSDIEEVKVLGRYISGAVDVVRERLNRDTPVDLLDAASISRVGDSDAAAALRRLPGLTLVEDKFVYVRGLGERYSSMQLNGAVIPSPDITRNVLPLDIFPADLIASMAVHKGFVPELGAAFGGGNVDIRTRKIPNNFTFNLGFKTGWSTSGTHGLSYSGGNEDHWGVDDGTRELSFNIRRAIETYRGNFAPLNISRTVINGIVPLDIDEARFINRSLATFLNRNIDLTSKPLPNDIEADIVAANRIPLTDNWGVGFLAMASYSNDWRLKERVNRRFANPITDYSETARTVNEVDVTASISLGTEFLKDHKIELMGLLIRNTEDDATSTRTCVQGQFNDCLDSGSPVQGRILGVRFEERELKLLQFNGSHTLGADTIALLPTRLLFLDRFEYSEVTWYYTDATATTSIPNEVRISGQESLTGPNGNVNEFRVRATGSAADFRFSDLEDRSVSFGYDIVVPITGINYDMEVSGGWDYARKVRSYKQTSLGLGSTHANFRSVSAGPPSEVFSNDNILNPDLDINLLLGVGEFGNESYIAVHVVDAGYGKINFLYQDRWRFSGGLRKELFTQFSLPIDYLNFEGNRLGFDTQEDVDEFVATILQTDEWFPSFNVTRTFPNLWYTEQVQFRFSVSQTVARPDVRETSASSYIDPITEARVRGNPKLQVSHLNNFDLRVELFWYNGDNFTSSFFYKDVDKPIETVQGGATEDNIRFNFVNAESAFVYGVEIEWLKSMGFLRDPIGSWTDLFFIAGNLTLSDSEISIPTGAGVGNLTNETRRMTQQSNWVINWQVGFDSDNGKHAATLVYNAFGERVYFAGIDGLPDGFEQPFHSIDFVYSWYPNNNLTLKGRVKNLLNSQVEVKQGSVSIIEQSIGTTVLMNATLEF